MFHCSVQVTTPQFKLRKHVAQKKSAEVVVAESVKKLQINHHYVWKFEATDKRIQTRRVTHSGIGENSTTATLKAYLVSYIQQYSAKAHNVLRRMRAEARLTAQRGVGDGLYTATVLSVAALGRNQ